MSIDRQTFGTTPDGIDVSLYTLTNNSGAFVKITNFGGIVVSVYVPDRNGALDDVVLGYDTLEEYIQDNPHFGAIAGRYANRIAGGKFILDGVQYSLAVNNGPNHLHGGIVGFDKVVWQAKTSDSPDGVKLNLEYLSQDGEEGYPGNLLTKISYTWTDKNELKIEYRATTDKPTVINLTNHSYFNLAGAGNGDILGHEMMIHADRFTPVNKNMIPTGEIKNVKDTPLDFTRPFSIGERINDDFEQLRLGRGYDHNYIINKKDDALAFAARVVEPATGRVLEVYTTEPGVQLYTGNFLDGHHIGKGGKAYQQRAGFCLETQHFPDSPNHSDFPSTILRPGQEFNSTTIFKFATIQEVK